MRVTIDIDGNAFRCVRAFFWLKYLFEKVFIRRSAFRGWHIVAFTKIKDFSVILLVRRVLGDDVTRIEFDEERLMKPKQVLWTCKDGRYAGEWWEDIERVFDFKVRICG